MHAAFLSGGRIPDLAAAPYRLPRLLRHRLSACRPAAAPPACRRTRKGKDQRAALLRLFADPVSLQLCRLSAQPMAHRPAGGCLRAADGQRARHAAVDPSARDGLHFPACSAALRRMVFPQTAPRSRVHLRRETRHLRLRAALCLLSHERLPVFLRLLRRAYPRLSLPAHRQTMGHRPHARRLQSALQHPALCHAALRHFCSVYGGGNPG